jgi:lipid-binding SYLF domain-containing protein
MALRLVAVVGCFLLGVSLTAPAWAARVSERETVRRASAALEQIMTTPAAGIPRQLLSNAQAIVIVPQMKGGAFIIGIRKGHGVLVVREDNGMWRAPQFVELTGGSVGWQAGVQSSDLVLVFHSRKSLHNLMQGKLTIGADASVAVGPVGRQVAAATDLDLSAEIYSYSRSRGAFVGVSIDGTVLKSDPQASARYYRQPEAVPPEAGRLISQLVAYSGTTVVAETKLTLPTDSPTDFSSSVIGNQRQLIEAAERLSAVLDPAWRRHLALPQEIYQATPIEPELFAGLDASLQRHEAVAANPQYAALSSRPEFQLALVSLRQAVSSTLPSDVVTLPPPPSDAQPSGPQFPQ